MARRFSMRRCPKRGIERRLFEERTSMARKKGRCVGRLTFEVSGRQRRLDHREEAQTRLAVDCPLDRQVMQPPRSKEETCCGAHGREGCTSTQPSAKADARQKAFAEQRSHRSTERQRAVDTAQRRPKRSHRRTPPIEIFADAPDKDEPDDRIRGSLGRRSFSGLRHNVQGERQPTAPLDEPKRANEPRRWLSARPKGYATGLQRRGDVLWCPWPGRMHRNAATCNTYEQQRALLHSEATEAPNMRKRLPLLNGATEALAPTDATDRNLCRRA